MTTPRPKTPQDQAALDAARAHLAALDAAPTDATVTHLTAEERAERLRRRAQARSLTSIGTTGTLRLVPYHELPADVRGAIEPRGDDAA